MEVHRIPTGRIRYLLGTASKESLDLTFEGLRQSLPGLARGSWAACPIPTSTSSWRTYVRVEPRVKDRSSAELRIADGIDLGTRFLRGWTGAGLRDAEIVVQFLFRPTFQWEQGRFRGPFFGLLADRPRKGVYLAGRHPAFPFHVELRVMGTGIGPGRLARAIEPWLDSWESTTGALWWSLAPVAREQARDFLVALENHDIFRFTSPRRSRDLSAAELTAVLPIPWKERHANVAYVGAPEGEAPVELSAAAVKERSIVLGRVGDQPVRLPDRWHHLAVVGKTGAGKSTLVQSIVLQILAKEPTARVIVLEPTGSLIEGIVGRLASEVAGDTIEIDPARSSFVEEKGGFEKIAVPLNLLALPDRHALDRAEFERRGEKLKGDLVQAIKNAWGEASIGGRAEYFLRQFVQALLAVDGTNVVDIHSALTDKAVIAQVERFAGVSEPLPRLSADLTISTLDKVGKISGNPLLRKALCQRYETVGFGELLRHRLLLLNLRDGQIGTDGATFLGAILLTQIWTALQERAPPSGEGATVPPPPIYLIVDEFQHYAIPAFTRMLSEGRRLGLRVIAATQTFDGIPEGVQPAILGNVDAWVLFPLGARDQREAWKIVQGHHLGWQVDDFAEGPLRPHQAAYFASGHLTKLTTEPSAPPPPTAANRRSAVDRSSRRYARPEDSEVSPLGVTQSQRVQLIGALSPDEGSTLDELRAVLGWSGPALHAAVSLSIASTDVARDGNGSIRLLPRGRFYRQAVLAARNEGEEHCGLLADALAYLAGFGIEAQIGIQRRVETMPDACFERGGCEYNLEVECSNLAKHPQQVIANLRKARNAGRRCLLAVADAAAAGQAESLVRARVPGAELWGEFGVVWRAAPGVMVPFAGEGAVEVWGWLLNLEEPDAEGNPGTILAAPTGQALPPAPTPRYELEVLSRSIARLLKLGKEWVSAREILEARDGTESLEFDERRVGYLLAALGIPNRRVRAGDGQVRIYRITEFTGPAG